MRRKFTDTLKSLPKELRELSPAQVGLDYCDKLFHLESGFTEQELSSRERYQARLEQSRPLAEKFFAWVAAEYERNPVPKRMFGAVLTYAVNQKSWLMNVFLDGRLELSNNRAERCAPLRLAERIGFSPTRQRAPMPAPLSTPSWRPPKLTA